MEKKRKAYLPPMATEIELAAPLSLFVALSMCGEVEDWESGAEI